jgi:two-component system phosphate regulon response regulator PhoB
MREADRNPNRLVYLVGNDNAQDAAAALSATGFEVLRLASAAAALDKAERECPALLLITPAIACEDRVELCRRVRSSSSLGAIAIVLLGQHGVETDCVGALEAGADDYLGEPFGPRELVARVNAVLRRRQSQVGKHLLVAGPLAIDTAAMTLSVSGKPVELSVTEFRLLSFFMEHPGRVFSRERILQEIRQDAQNIGKRAVDVYIRRVRQKIGADARHSYLKTVRGTGYMFQET